MKSILDSYFALDKRIVFVAIASLSVFFAYYEKEVIMTEALALHSYGSLGKSELFMSNILRLFNEPFTFFDAFRVLLLKAAFIGFVALLLYIGIRVAKFSLSFWQIFGVVVFAELAFVMDDVLRILYFSFQDSYTYSDWKLFHTLSLHTLFSREQAIVNSTLSKLHIYELLYVFLLGYGLFYKSQHQENPQLAQASPTLGLRIASLSYGLVLLLYTLGFMLFVLLNMSQSACTNCS